MTPLSTVLTVVVVGSNLTLNNTLCEPQMFVLILGVLCIFLYIAKVPRNTVGTLMERKCLL